MEVVRTLWCPKEGSTDEQYEDAFCVAEGSVAVADGASAAFFARQWAQLLVEDFAGGAPVPDRDGPFWERVAALGERWGEQVDGGEMGAGAWWAAEKLPEGSQASLLVCYTEEERKLHAASVGDVCLFVVRQDRLKWAFPLTKSLAFSNHPALVPTDPTRLRRRPPVVRRTFSLESGDRIFLATDALAQWFLSRHEQRTRPWDELPAEETALRDWVQARRDDNSLKNDDVTLLELLTGP